MAEFIIREYTEDDLPALVTHMKESVDGWPPGEFAGWDFTPEGIRESLFKHKQLAEWVAVIGDKIIGFMNYNSHYNEPDARYLMLLNVQPDYHGIGAGRDLLRSGVKQAVEDEAKRLDLHTWAANMKALPLYKKTGFFWRPRTEVHMYNFLPTVLRNPYVINFLDGDDWYKHLRQELSLEESLDVVDGCHVQRYYFEKDGRKLEVRVDPSTSGIIGLIADDIDIRCMIAGEKHISGVSYPVRWAFTNRKSRPANVSLSCKGTSGIDYEFNEQFELTGEKIFENTATLAPGAKPPREDWWGLPIDCTITMDDLRMEFRPGLKAMPPFEIGIHRGPVVLAPGGEERHTFNMQSRFPSEIVFLPTVKVEGKIALAEPASEEPMNIPPEASVGINVRVKAEDEVGDGKISIGGVVKFEGREVEIEPLSVYVRVVEKGRAVAVKDENPNVTYIANDKIYIRLKREEGGMQFLHRDSGKRFLSISGHSIGEPFSEEMDNTLHEVITDEGASGVHAVMRGVSKDFPGMILEQHVKLGTGTEFTVWEELVNEGENPFSGRVMLSFYARGLARLTIPLAAGLVQGHPGYWLMGNSPLPDDPEAYAEPWIGFEKDGRITGMITGSFDTVTFRHWAPVPRYEWKVENLAPSARVVLPEVRIITDAPGVDHIRRIALRGNERELDEIPREPMHLRTPVFCFNDGVCPLSFNFLRRGAVQANAKAELPDGTTFKTESQKWDFENPMRIDIPLEGKQPGIVPVKYNMGTVNRVEGDVTPLVILPAGAEVDISEKKEGVFQTFIVDNGAYKFKVSPEYSGTMHWLSESVDDADNLLCSPFPDTGEYTWLRPWFGGLGLFSWWIGYRFHTSGFSGEPDEIEMFGHQWKGVRVDISLLRDLASLKMELFYLTLPGSPVIMTLIRLTETAGCRRIVNFEGLLFPRPGGDDESQLISRVNTPSGTVVISQDGDGGDHSGRTWTCVTDSATGRTIGLINPHGGVSIWDNAKEGHIPCWANSFHTHPERPAQFAAFYCITDDPDNVPLLAKELRYWVV